MIRIHLFEILQEKGMNQKELCEKIHARPSTISNLCNENVISIKIKLIEDICKELNCSPSDLFEIT